MIFYKDEFVSLVLKEEGETNEHYFADLLDSRGEYITYISKDFIKETITELKQCKTDKEVCEYLVDLGMVLYVINKDEIEDYRKELSEYLYEDEELTLENLYNNDYINVVGDYAIVME